MIIKNFFRKIKTAAILPKAFLNKDYNADYANIQTGVVRNGKVQPTYGSRLVKKPGRVRSSEHGK